MNRCPLSSGGDRTVNGWKWVLAAIELSAAVDHSSPYKLPSRLPQKRPLGVRVKTPGLVGGRKWRRSLSLGRLTVRHEGLPRLAVQSLHVRLLLTVERFSGSDYWRFVVLAADAAAGVFASEAAVGVLATAGPVISVAAANAAIRLRMTSSFDFISKRTDGSQR